MKAQGEELAFDERRDPYNKGKKVNVSIVAGRFVDWMVADGRLLV